MGCWLMGFFAVFCALLLYNVLLFSCSAGWVGGSVRGCVHGFVFFFVCVCVFSPPLNRPRAGIVRRTTSN